LKKQREMAEQKAQTFETLQTEPKNQKINIALRRRVKFPQSSSPERKIVSLQAVM